MRDSDVRTAVLRELTSTYSDDPHTKVVEEMGIWSGSARIDIAVINGELCGIELKSDRDTLERLKLQSELFSRVFDRIDIVVGKRHVQRAGELIPQWWGITVAFEEHGTVHLDINRLAARNPSPDPYLIAQLLWRDEAINVLQQNGLAKGWRTKPVNLLHQRLAMELPIEYLRNSVRTTIKSRERWLRQAISDE